MIAFLMALVVMLFASDIPRDAGGKPKEKPPDLEPTDKPFAYATAFYWEMYGATAEAHNADVTEASALTQMLGEPMNEERSMTDENADAWAMIAPVHQIQRLTDWANMLESRVKEFDPNIGDILGAKSIP